jgi:hypothetical protein
MRVKYCCVEYKVFRSTGAISYDHTDVVFWKTFSSVPRK